LTTFSGATDSSMFVSETLDGIAMDLEAAKISNEEALD
jgi:hypothetical protein